MKCIFASALIAAAASAQQVVDQSFLQVGAAPTPVQFDLVKGQEAWEVPLVSVGKTSKKELSHTRFALNKSYTYLSSDFDETTLDEDEWDPVMTGMDWDGIKGDTANTQISINATTSNDFKVMKQTDTDSQNWLGFGRQDTTGEMTQGTSFFVSVTEAQGTANGWEDTFSIGRGLEDDAGEKSINVSIGAKNADLFKAQPEEQPTQFNAFSKDSTSYIVDLSGVSTVTADGTDSPLTMTAKQVVFSSLTEGLTFPKADLAALEDVLFTADGATKACEELDLPDLHIKLAASTLSLPYKVYTQQVSQGACQIRLHGGDDPNVVFGGKLFDEFYATFKSFGSDQGIAFEVAKEAAKGVQVLSATVLSMTAGMITLASALAF